MTVENDAALLLAHLDSIGVTGSDHITRGWGHIGALLVDAALQRQRNYAKVVEPRARAIKDAWPDADTTSGFRKRLKEHDLGEVITYRSESRIKQIEEMAVVLELHGVETAGELREALEDPERRPLLRRALDSVKFVGPKTLDYLEILAGISSVAIDSRIIKITKAAGIKNTAYDHLATVVRAAAAERGWRPGDLDAVLWRAAEES